MARSAPHRRQRQRLPPSASTRLPGSRGWLFPQVAGISGVVSCIAGAAKQTILVLVASKHAPATIRKVNKLQEQVRKELRDWPSPPTLSCLISLYYARTRAREGRDSGLGVSPYRNASLRPVGFLPTSRPIRIESGQLCRVMPVDPAVLEVGDIVLCTVHGNEYLHIVKAIDGGRFQIGNNHGFINGWIGPNSIHGKCVRIEPDAARVATDSSSRQLLGQPKASPRVATAQCFVRVSWRRLCRSPTRRAAFRTYARSSVRIIAGLTSPC